MSTTNPAAPGAASAANVEELCNHLRALPRPDSALLCDFARTFFAKVPRSLAEERSPQEMAAMTLGAWEFLLRSRPDEVNVELADPREEGWPAPITAIRAEVGDRPFIVDTIREYLNAESIPILHYIYPVLRVGRDEAGRIVSVDGGGSGDGRSLEALVHCEVPHVARPEQREEIRAEVERRLTDVVEATSDFHAMLDALDTATAAVSAYAERAGERAHEFAEYVAFLRWLRDGNFVFLGFRSYTVGGDVLQVDPGSGLGILADTESSAYADPTPLDSLPETLRARVVGGPPLVVSKANRESTVHRRARMDYVGVRKLDEAGIVAGEWRFLGLFTSQAYAQSPAEIPILRHKLRRILESSGTRPGSHDYKEIISIVASMPKEELFQATAEQLQAEVSTILGQLFSDEVSVSLRPDPQRGEMAAMVILPRGRYSAEVRKWVGGLLAARLEGTVRSHFVAFSSGDQARLHFYVSSQGARGVAQGDDARALERRLERELNTLLRSWADRLEELLAESMEPAEARRLVQTYGPTFGEEYRAATLPEAALHDVLYRERMRAGGTDVALHFRQPVAGEAVPPNSTVLKLFLHGERMVLSDFMPILEDTGVRVVEVDTYELAGAGAVPPTMVYAFYVQTRDGEPIPGELTGPLAECLLAARSGDAPRDPYNALVLRAGVRWRQADVLRTYGNYAHQIGAIPSRLAPVRALTAYPRVACLLVDAFEARFDPAREGREEAQAAIHVELLRELEKVTSLADDRALRRMMNLIEATVRTNYFRHGGATPTGRSGGVPYISIKVRNADVEELKKNRLLYEVYVHSSRMEGVHLRGASVARGGIRWSDRHDDFRTEVLGLVLTQVVKNATIVPSGSKGGFITKRTFAERDAQLEERRQQYMTLMRGLLDVTDNLVDGKVVPPEGVVRHDGDDPYLVVAADKGTADLSDTANGVAAEYGFWLGDAFASGGSQGYDHKREGITARGAWECVKRHFREAGKDIQTEPFTVAGVGDMSGDVFGNGMLLSRQIRLLAAFDHRHIFIDPDPDPAASYAERERMFRLPRSSWEDYDRALWSPGAMLVPRASKEVELTPGARAALGLPEDVTRLDGEGLVRAILTAPVELLWNGGIGTYVKDAEETHADAGDTTNDPVRVDAQQLRCQVVGEGGNLGFTQRGRITAALRGVRLNTDALDNSAGVDMSDHEVNLKILLNRVVEGGRMDVEGRNELLASMTDEVSELVLRNNNGQSLAVSLDQARSREALDDFAALIVQLERDRRLDREAEGLPAADEIRDRASERQGLTRPTLSVLLAHSKLYAKAQLLESTTLDDPALDSYLIHYFPAAAVRAAGEAGVKAHQLRREIVATELVNDLVNLMGSSFLHRVSRDSGAGIPEVVRAWLVASRIAGAPEIRADMAAAEGKHPQATVYRWLAGLARVLEATTHWILAHTPAGAQTVAVIDEARTALEVLRGAFGSVVAGEDRVVYGRLLEEVLALGVERTLAERLITLRFLPQLLEIAQAARGAGTDTLATAQAYYLVSERLATARLQESLRTAAGDDPWNRRHAQSLSDDVAAAQRHVVAETLARSNGAGPAEALAALEAERAREVRAYRELLSELRGVEAPLSAYALAVRQLAAVAKSA
jgi:glutamate dehydrogenase